MCCINTATSGTVVGAVPGAAGTLLRSLVVVVLSLPSQLLEDGRFLPLLLSRSLSQFSSSRLLRLRSDVSNSVDAQLERQA